MGHSTTAGKSLHAWYSVHALHDYEIVATDQVCMICHTCELLMTADEIFAGFDVTFEAALKADDLLELPPAQEETNA